jgi:hypothetical protein
VRRTSSLKYRLKSLAVRKSTLRPPAVRRAPILSVRARSPRLVSGFELDQQVDIAVRPTRTASDRPEQRQLADVPAAAERSQRIVIGKIGHWRGTEPLRHFGERRSAPLASSAKPISSSGFPTAAGSRPCRRDPRGVLVGPAGVRNQYQANAECCHRKARGRPCLRFVPLCVRFATDGDIAFRACGPMFFQRAFLGARALAWRP